MTEAKTIIRALAMHAENQQRAACNESPAYSEQAFMSLLEGSPTEDLASRWRSLTRQLLEMSVPKPGAKTYRYAAVGDTFGIGFQLAAALCREFGVSWGETVHGPEVPND